MKICVIEKPLKVDNESNISYSKSIECLNSITDSFVIISICIPFEAKL